MPCVSSCVHLVVNSWKYWSVYLYMHIYARGPGGPCPARDRLSWRNGYFSLMRFSCRIKWSNHHCLKCLCYMALWDRGNWCFVYWHSICEIKQDDFEGCDTWKSWCILFADHTPMFTVMIIIIRCSLSWSSSSDVHCHDHHHQMFTLFIWLIK